eukprot:5200045-Pleurochrysis_carterae.AAC.1
MRFASYARCACNCQLERIVACVAAELDDPDDSSHAADGEGGEQQRLQARARKENLRWKEERASESGSERERARARA